MIFTSEQVSCGHPDKICDQISDAIVTDCLSHDKNSRVAAECMIKDYDIIIAGEITSSHQPDYEKLAREVLNRIGIFGAEDFRIQTFISRQSADIALGVDGNGGAGDQGMMFGYATDETPEMLPIPFAVATRALRLLRETGCPILLPDAKSQVSYDYEKGRITTFLISTQHLQGTTVEDIRPIVEVVMDTAAQDYGLNTDFEKLVNPTGRFVVGSSFADSGLTGRKIIADTYGGACRHGGGAFSGKDPTKVDRSAAYMARYVAKNIIAAGAAKKCEVQIAYAIGVARPLSVCVKTFGTGVCGDDRLADIVNEVFDLRPAAIIEQLDLRKPIYKDLSAYGHFGREELGVRWESTDKADEIKSRL